MEPLLDVNNITKSLGGSCIVRGLSFTLYPGESVGLLGLNGAGKTTTLQLLATLLTPDSGQILFCGQDVRKHTASYRDAIGFLADDARLYSECTVHEHLKFLARLRGLSARETTDAIARVVEQCDLGNALQVLCANLSRGYRQRVGLAAALLHNPTLLFLDEPMGALDPKQREHFRTLLLELKASGVTILHSSHLLQEVGSSCERVIIFHNGSCAGDLPVAGDLAELERSFLAAVSNTATRRKDVELAA